VRDARIKSLVRGRLTSQVRTKGRAKRAGRRYGRPHSLVGRDPVQLALMLAQRRSAALVSERQCDEGRQRRAPSMGANKDVSFVALGCCKPRAPGFRLSGQACSEEPGITPFRNVRTNLLPDSRLGVDDPDFERHLLPMIPQHEDPHRGGPGSRAVDTVDAGAGGSSWPSRPDGLSFRMANRLPWKNEIGGDRLASPHVR